MLVNIHFQKYNRYNFFGKLFIMVIALSGVQFGLISKSNEHAARVRFQTKIARPEVQLPLY